MDNSTEIHRVSRNKPSQESERSLQWKLKDIEKGNRDDVSQ